MIVIDAALQAHRVALHRGSRVVRRVCGCGVSCCCASSGPSRRRWRASDSPIAIACLRLVTFLPDRPLRSVPRLRSRITFSTFFDAFLLYFRAMGAPSDNPVVGKSSTKRASGARAA